MCLALPAQIISRNIEQAHVNCGGLELNVDVSLVPDAQVGDFVIVHVGIALSVMSPDDAHEAITTHREFAAAQKEGPKP